MKTLREPGFLRCRAFNKWLTPSRRLCLVFVSTSECSFSVRSLWTCISSMISIGFKFLVSSAKLSLITSRSSRLDMLTLTVQFLAEDKDQKILSVGVCEPMKGAQSRVQSVRDYPVRFSCVRSSLL